MCPKIDLEDLYSRVMPYLSDPLNIKEFLENLNCDEMDERELMEHIDNALKDAKGTLKTDFRIVLNTIK
ncbi:MAG: hypothetical protein KAJ51_09805 [Thermoplasmata archaeon]|nr:hypothetical protein [Thermoplasmata archaeon]